MGAQASPGLVKSMVSLEKKKSLGPFSGKILCTFLLLMFIEFEILT